MRPALFAALAFAAITPAVAQLALPKEAPGKPDPRIVTPGRYTMDPGHSQILFTVSHMGWASYTGQFASPTGTLIYDAKTPARSKVEVTIPIARIQTTDRDLDKNLQAADYFDTARFPTATFVSTRVTLTGKASATITGKLTLKGVTRPVTLTARFIGAGPEFWGDKKLAIGFAATTTIKRSDFGVSGMVPLMSDRTDLVINAGFTHE